MKRLWAGLIAVFAVSGATAGTIDQVIDPETGWTIITANQGDMSITIVPDAGANVSSLQYQGTQMVRQPDTMAQLRGFRYGIPILYPTPNRVRDSKMTFQDQEYNFVANDGANFLHGLVHSAPFDVIAVKPMDDQVLIQTQLVFTPGTPWYQAFPHKHTLKVDVSVRNDAVRWTYTVDNKTGDQDVPFGFALHPWFLYQGDRADTFLTIPASHLMESKELLPTGRLVSLDGTPFFDARKPLSLANFVIDDVYYGLRSQTPVVIDFKDPRIEIGLFATADFTHLVVYTPDQEPYFCVENQTCSTDAHNLHTQGKEREAHLLIAETGNLLSGWVEYRFKNY